MAERRDVEWLFEAMAGYGNSTAIVDGEVRWGYGELLERVAARGRELRDAGIGPGSVVAPMGDFSRHSAALFLALAQSGCIIAPIAVDVEDEVRDRLDAAGVEFVAESDGRGEAYRRRDGAEPAALVREFRERGRSGLVLFSSGSTGRPKAMLHDLDTLVASYRGRRPRPLRMGMFLLFDHIGGINTFFSGLSIGAALVRFPSRDPEEVAAVMERAKVRVLPTSPSFLNLLLVGGAGGRHDLSSLRMVTYGTEPMPPSLLERLRQAFPKVRFIQTFGTSETGIGRTTGREPGSTAFRIEPGDTGARVVDGELQLRSSTQVLGYLNHGMDDFTEDGWFRTGDLVEELGDGYIKVVGRLRDVINVGGRKVLPAEVESALLALPDVVDCMVYGRRHVLTGQAVAADVVVRDASDASKVKRAIRRSLLRGLEEYKVPAGIRLVDAIEMGSRFKKMRPKL